jgi:hypothetical protein
MERGLSVNLLEINAIRKLTIFAKTAETVMSFLSSELEGEEIVERKHNMPSEAKDE